MVFEKATFRAAVRSAEKLVEATVEQAVSTDPVWWPKVGARALVAPGVVARVLITFEPEV